MAAFTLGLLKHGPLHGSTHGRLHYDARVGDDFLGLDGNLLGQLSCWRDDDGPDVAWLCALVATGPFGESGVILDDSLDDGNEETEGFAGAGLCLSDATAS